MNKELLSYARFERIMNTIMEFEAKQDKVSKFFEDELMSTWCMFSYGETLSVTLVNMLADEFDCWWEEPALKKVKLEDGKFVEVPDEDAGKQWWEVPGCYYVNNDISWWLYESDKRTIEINGKEMDVSDLKDFYSFLVSHCKKC